MIGSNSIVFVHGLNGNRINTWTSEDGYFWPNTFLPVAVPNSRILSWGYDADVIKWWGLASFNEVEGHASNLSSDLANLRSSTNSSDRPIIFVCHSQGGLVTKCILTQERIHGDRNEQNIPRLTKGVLFLGTPHAGSSAASWAEIGRKILRWCGVSTTKDGLKNLNVGSEKLRLLSEEFGRVLFSRNGSKEACDNLQISCFYEEKATPLFNAQIVTKESATIPGYEKEVLSIPADHSHMCKFSDVEDEGYIRVKGVLERWVKSCETTKHEEPRISIVRHGSNFSGANYSGF